MIFLVVLVVVGIALRLALPLTDSEIAAGDSCENKKYYLDHRGYLRFQNSGKLFHRYIAGKKLGRRLYSYEVVHHKDRNKRNNRPENLYVCLQSEHAAIHGFGKLNAKQQLLASMEGELRIGRF